MIRILLLTSILFCLPAGASGNIRPIELETMQLADTIQQIGPFEVEPGLENRVKFWITVYTKVHRWQYLFHDAEHPEIIYGILDVKKIKEHPYWNNWRKRRGIFRKRREFEAKIKSTLASIHEKIYVKFLGPENLTYEEKKIYKLFANVQGDSKFKDAMDRSRIRSQPGLRQNFVESIYESGRYLPGMKQIAVQFGVPPETVYLPFVESGFDREALSKVGASGIWQFIRSTGKFFLRVDDVVDERNDPMKAAEGAALLMKQNYSALEHWPLAITAYNYGRKGMQDAVKKLKTFSLAKIIERWDGYTFGFASKNFYSSFFAALHVAKNASFYFGAVERAEPAIYENFVMPEYVEFQVLAKHVGISEDILKDYNPALTDLVITGKKLIPVGYNLRIPISQRDAFLRRYGTIPPKFRFRKQRLDASAASKKLTTKK